MSVQLDRAWIEGHIPHQGRMCLLDQVCYWDQVRIECSSASHRAADHPLRAHGRLGSACLIEYAAQAMAVHGALLAAPAARAPTGMLASARAVELRIAQLDGIAGELLICAEREHGDARGALYAFRIMSAQCQLAQGRAAVMFGAGP